MASVPVAAALATIAGCGGGGQYPAALRERFVESCSATDSSARAACVCMVDKLQKQVSADALERADAAISAGLDPDSDVQDALLDAAQECAKG